MEGDGRLSYRTGQINYCDNVDETVLRVCPSLEFLMGDESYLFNITLLAGTSKASANPLTNKINSLHSYQVIRSIDELFYFLFEVLNYLAVKRVN